MEQKVEKQHLSLAGKTYPFKSLTPCGLRNCTRSQIKEYFENSYNLDEVVFTAITDEQYFFKCPDRLRLPLIFYLAHTASVYVNKMLLGGLIEKRVESRFEKMFETGVDEMSWDDTENYRMGGSYDWPSVSEVLDYRQRVKEVILKFIDTAPLELPITREHPWWALFMGMEHERIHLETSSVLLRQLPVSALKRPVNWKYAPASMDTPADPNEFVNVPTGKVTLGKPEDFPSYGWDNEYGQAVIDVPEFRATKYLVTNKDFLEFVEDCGYQRKELWTTEGWRWVAFREAKHPSFWVCDNGCKSGCGSDLATYSHCTEVDDDDNMSNGASANSRTKYKYRAIYDVIDMPWDWPVDVNYHEAKAFCSWKGPGYRMPTEAEHHRMRGDPPPSCDTSCDPAYCPDYPANINFKYGSSTPVNMFPPSSMGFYDVYGNVWKWVEDHFNGLPGFKTHYLYDDFSSPCFDGRHTMITGGSWISTGDEASRFARFSFRRHFFQHLGFRMVHSANPTPVRLCTAEVFVLGAGVGDNPIISPGVEKQKSCVCSTNLQFEYECEEKLDVMLKQQYDNGLSHNPPLLQYVEQVTKDLNIKKSNAINFGCGTGLHTFLLTRSFQKVVGVDYSGRFLDAAISLQSTSGTRGQGVLYLGEDGQKKEAILPEGVNTNRAIFKQMTWIPNEIEGFDFVLFEFLDRLSEPKGWLRKLWECVTPNGVVVIATTEEWGRERIEECIGKWFTFKQSSVVAGQMVTVWKSKICTM